MSPQATTSYFSNLDALAAHFRSILDRKEYILLFAYNGTGKTRLSGAFKNLGQQPIPDNEEKRPTHCTITLLRKIYSLGITI